MKMVNSCNSRSPILLDTPERPSGSSVNTSVIEIPDNGERSQTRRRRHESVEDVIIADSPKRARVDVPVIDLTTDNEEESSPADNHSGLLFRLENTPYYADLMRRGHYLSDHNRYMRLRRSAALCRATSHHSRQQQEDHPSNLARSNSEPAGQNNNFLNGVLTENPEQAILVDDDDSAAGRSSIHDQTSGFSRPSCSRVWSPRVSTTDSMRPTPSLGRSERSRLLYGAQAQESTDSDSERRSYRRDTSQQLRAIRRNQRRFREQSRHLRERLEHISSTFTHIANNSLHENFGRTVQPPPSQETGVHSSVYVRPNQTVETNHNTRRSSPLHPEARQIDIHDIMSPLQPPLQDIMLPALLSIWGPDSRLRHFGDPDDDGEDYEALLSLSERLGQVKPKGLCKAEMEQIPAFRYSAASKDSSNGSCVVCMMNYSNKEKLRRLPCNHDFHAKCIDRWLKNNRSCPVCRKDVATK